MTSIPWPAAGAKKNLEDTINKILKTREDDIADFNGLKSAVGTRKVARVPSSSTDTATTDKVGDFNFDQNYVYYAVLDTGAGALRWRRIALGTW